MLTFFLFSRRAALSPVRQGRPTLLYIARGCIRDRRRPPGPASLRLCPPVRRNVGVFVHVSVHSVLEETRCRAQGRESRGPKTGEAKRGWLLGRKSEGGGNRWIRRLQGSRKAPALLALVNSAPPTPPLFRTFRQSR